MCERRMEPITYENTTGADSDEYESGEETDIIETSRRDGMMTMDTALKEAVVQGRVAYDEALRYVLNPKILPPPV